jgi:pSer/pThr/pTyr-binding forkhead associated (FHA) protein
MAAPSALFEVVAGKAVGMSIVVDDELVIGRNAHGAGQLAEDGELSRSHARIALDGNGFCAIEDLGSTNGTFVNGLRISTPQTLSEGDTIELGGTTLVARAVPALQTQTTSQFGTAQALPAPTPKATPIPSPESAESPESGPASESESGPASESAALAEVEQPDEPADSATAAATLSMQLHVDFSAREARLLLGDVEEPVRLVYDAGVWRFAPPATTENPGS